MSGTGEMDEKELQLFLKGVATHSLPTALPVPERPGRVVRRFVVRGTVPLDTARAAELGASFAATARERICEQTAGTASEAEIDANTPTTTITPFDDSYAVVEIEFAAHAHSVGDSAAIAQFGALRDLHHRWRIIDLQGLPIRSWFFFHD